jgi:hypothetical protein
MGYPWGHNRRFNAYSDYLKQQFGSRVQKVTINAGFTCPNRDGTKSTGGCTFCNNEAFNPSYCVDEKPVENQITEGIEFHRKRYKKAHRFLAYFQAYSNTYASLKSLKQVYEPALNHPDVVGLVIGTRPDCINHEKLKYFSEIAQHKYVIIEYGIESCFDSTLQRINRGHSFEDTREALERTKEMGIRTGGHMIFGLPGESKHQMLEGADIISRLPLDNVKFHQLQIFKGTKMETTYASNPEEFNLFGFEEYIEFSIDYVERLNPDIVIERIAGESPPRFIVTNIWNKRYDLILQHFENRLEHRDTWQGKIFK